MRDLLALLPLIAMPDVAAAGSTPIVAGVVCDSLSQAPIDRAHVSIETEAPPGSPAVTALTNAAGKFALPLAPAGGTPWPPAIPPALIVRHVAYEPRRQPITLPAPGDTLFVSVNLVPHAHRVGEILVEVTRVTPLTSSHTTRYTLPRTALETLPVDKIEEIVALVPGVVVNGDQPLFRGLGLEHVLPLIDGVPAREPIKGEWIMPPPNAVASASLVSGAFGAEYGQALAGAIEMNLAAGGPRRRSRVRYATDRLDVATETETNTDRVELSVSGPTPDPRVFYSLAWQGHLTDTQSFYDHAIPEQTVFGTLSLGDRMLGELAGSLKLSIRPGDRPWEASLVAIHSASRRKAFRFHYGRSGYVAVDTTTHLYTTFVPGENFADSTQFYDGPARAPTTSRTATVLLGSYTRRLGAVGDWSVSARVALHDYETRGSRGRLGDEDAVDAWIREETTRYGYQSEPYFATHGDYPGYEDGESREASINGRSHFTIPGGHHLSAGAGGTLGRHRLLGVVPHYVSGQPARVGRLHDWLETFDGFVYAEDTWRTDEFSSLTFALRYDAQEIWGYPGRASAGNVSPRLGFHQPMTDRDAVHVQAGVFYQFPALESHFTFASLETLGVELISQRTRTVEVGLQHHFSRKLVVYVTPYLRRSSRVVYARRHASAFSAYLDTTPSGLSEIETFGVETTLDHRLHPKISGQISLTLGRSEDDDVEIPSSRTFFVKGWLAARPVQNLGTGLSWLWSSGEPYRYCLSGRCDDADIRDGTLPMPSTVDATATYSFNGRGDGPRLFVEIRNLLNRRIPFFDFDLFPVEAIGTGNLIDYYERTGEAGGYVIEGTDEDLVVPLDNPQAMTPGRNVRAGIELRF
jgi:hypothetical protein